MANQISINEYAVTLVADSKDEGLLRLLTSVDNIFVGRKKDTYYCSLHKMPEVLEILRGVTSDERLSGRTKELYIEEMNRRLYTEELKRLGPQQKSDFLWDHQQLAVELAQVNRRYGLFYDTRLGKTLAALQIMDDAIKAGKAKRCLVVCPSSIIKSWLGDAAKYFPEMKIVAYYGTPKQKSEALKAPSNIVLWSLEQAVSCMDMLMHVKWDIGFVDESSKLKNHASEISKAMRELSLVIPSWYLLSATPAPNNESEYYTQLMTIDPYAFNPARGKFIAKYFDNTSRNPAWEKLKIKEDMRAEFIDKINEYSIYVDQKVMPTAGKEWHVVTYELPDALATIYDQMRNEMATEVHGTTIMAEMAAAMRAKLNQITSGFVMDTSAIKENKIARKLDEDDDFTEIYRLAGNDSYSRVVQLYKLLEGLGDQKVVIWANYKEEFKMLEELFKDKARYIRGGCSIAEKEQYINEFKKGNLQYLVCHPLSVGMGINLTEACVAIYYSLNDSYEALKQSSERIAGHIIVQPKKCHYYILQASGTINGIVYDNLINKRDKSFGLLEHLKAGALHEN